MVVKNLQTIIPHVWIPPICTANYKVTVERTDGTIDDITDILLSMKIEDGPTSTIGGFEFEIPNPNETYTGVWTGMEIFRYYCDYAAGVASTLRFRGRIEKPSYRNNNVLVTGRGEGLFVQGISVIKDYDTKDVGYIIKDIFDTYAESRFDTSTINVSTGVTLTISFSDLPFWEAIEAVCEAAGYDCYVNCNLIVKLFETGTEVNTGEAIVHDYNLVEVGDFAPDLSTVKNQIRLIGGSVDGVQVMYTANDTASQTAYGIKREPVTDDGIVSFEVAKEYAEYLLEKYKTPEIEGEVKGILLATIQPGESIRLSSPLENIPPGTYRIVSYTHEIGNEGLYTTVTINKGAKKVSDVLKERIQREHKQTSSSTNPDDLDYSEMELFNANVGSMSGTKISDGVLLLIDEATPGTWISPAYGPGDGRVFDDMKIDIFGDNLPGATIGVSINNGVSFQTVNKATKFTLSAGTSVMIKLTLTSTTQIDSLLIQYSMTT
jgi:hypothetical protein